MTAYLPPTRDTDREAIYRRLARKRLKPVAFAGRLWGVVGRMGPAQALVVAVGTLAGTTFGLLLGSHDPALALLAGLLSGLLGAIAVLSLRQWAWAHRPDPMTRWEAEHILQSIQSDPRLVAQVDAWLVESGLGSLTQAQVEALDNAWRLIHSIDQWEEDHRQTHACLEKNMGTISRLQARTLAKSLDAGLPAAARAPSRSRM